MNWIWIVPAIPPLLVIFLVIGLYVMGHIPATNLGMSGYDVETLGLEAIVVTWIISILVGGGMLLLLTILFIKGTLSFSHPKVKLSIALAVLDIAIPIGLLLLILHGLRNMHMWP